MTRRQRIALLHYSAPPVVGGVEAVLRRHAGLLADHGYPVQVIAGRGQPWDERIPVRVLPLLDSRHPEVQAAKRRLDAGQVPDNLETLIDGIRQTLRPVLQGMDVLLAHNVCSLHKNLALTAALQRMWQAQDISRLILWHHDLAWTASRYRRELHAGWPWDLLRNDWGAEHVVVSAFRQRELAELMAMPPGRIQVIPNGVDATSLLKLDPLTKQLVRELHLNEAMPILLLPARLTRRKNIELAIRASAHLRQNFPALALLITGPPGPHNPGNVRYFNDLKAMTADLGLEQRVHFLAEGRAEPLSDEIIGDLYRLADALVLPSHEEGFGIPLLEAALARLPVFCAEIEPLRELGGEQAHYFSPEAEPQEVARLIASVLSGAPGFAAAVRARQLYDWERIFTMHIEPLVQG